jgi:hypothetical protein
MHKSQTAKPAKGISFVEVIVTVAMLLVLLAFGLSGVHAFNH